MVRLDPGVNVSVSGSLVEKGEQYKKVRFEPNEAGQPWGGIDAAGITTRTIDLTYTTLGEGGTKADLANYTLRVRGNPNDAPYVDAIRVDHVTVEKSASVGMEVFEGARPAPRGVRTLTLSPEQTLGAHQDSIGT